MVNKMLEFVTSKNHIISDYIKDDPIRPEISIDDRFSSNRFVSTIIKKGKPLAITCVSINNDIPSNVEELMRFTSDSHVAVFYTIWSYERGYGRKLLMHTVKNIVLEYPTVYKFVTLSPKTEMAKKFHIANGASIFRENTDSVNYEYHIK